MASRAEKACTSRNCRPSAPGTSVTVQFSPPSVVRATRPWVPATQTVFSFTMETAQNTVVESVYCSSQAGSHWGTGVAAGWQPRQAARVIAVTNLRIIPYSL